MTTALDGLVNVATGLGTSASKRQHAEWRHAMLNAWQQLDACYQSNWIARRIVDTPARDMTREWRRIKSTKAEEIERHEQELGIRHAVAEALAWARLYGGAGILLLTGQDLSQPLRPERVRKGGLERVLVFDRWELNAQTLNTWDVLAPNYLQPEWYTVQGGHQHIHWTHVVRFYGERLPRRQMAQTQGWGDSVLRKCIEEITDMVAAKGGIAELMQEANIDVIKREGLSDELASDQDDMITKRYQAFSLMKSVIQMALLDDNETLERQTLNLSGVAPIIEEFRVWIAGAAEMPLTKVFGTSAKGMNATGEGDERQYNDDIRARQGEIAPAMRTLDEVMVRSATGTFPDDYDYVWNPLSQPDQVESAQAQLLQAQRDAAYLEAGVIQTSQVQRSLQSNEVYQFDDDRIAELEDMEDANLFESLPPVSGEGEEEEEPPAPEPVEGNDTGGFVERYRDLIATGATHDQAMRVLNVSGA